MLPWKTPREETLFDNLMLPPVRNIKFLCYALIFLVKPVQINHSKPSTRNDNNDLPRTSWFSTCLKGRKWRDIQRLLKDQNGKLFRKSCTAFPNIASKKIEFVKGWSVNEDGFKDEYSRGMMKTRSMLHAWRSLKNFMLFCQITSFLALQAGQEASSIRQWWTTL